MSQPTQRASRLSSALCLVLLAPWVSGCPVAVSDVLDVIDVLDGGGVTIIIDRPTECYQEDVIATDCFTQQTLVTYCEEDFFGFVDCYDEVVLELVCEDVVVDSFLVCG